MDLHAFFFDLDNSHHFVLTAEMLEQIMGSTVGGDDIVVDLWADTLGKLGLVEVVVLDVDLVLRLRHLVSGGP